MDGGKQYNAIYVNPNPLGIHRSGPVIRHVTASAVPQSDYDHGTGIAIIKNSPRLEHVVTYGKSIGIFNNLSSTKLFHVDTSAGFDAGTDPVGGAGIYNIKSTVEMDHVSAKGYFNIGYGDGMINRNGSHASIRNSSIGGEITNDSSSSANFANSQFIEAYLNGGKFYLRKFLQRNLKAA